LICGILGPKRGRKYLPFLGTLFIYILFMNLIGMIPFMKSATSNLSTTLALSLCVFIYVTYTAIKELGVIGYIDHLAGKPRGMMLFTAVMPIMLFVLHTFSEIVRPVTLSLRLRSNVWGDDMLLALFAGWGLKGLPFLMFSMALTLLSSIVQALVFCLLSAIYFALIFSHDEDETHAVEVKK
jgi:F-type H+-transporting ATPase subunit a